MVATITFVGPMIIFLLSNFSAGKKRREELAALAKESIHRDLQEAVPSVNKKDLPTVISNANNQYNKVEKEAKAEKNRLNPIRQFWFVYGFLAGAFFFLILFLMSKCNTPLI